MSAKEIKTFSLNLDGQTYLVKRSTFPFREGVELETEVNGKPIRVSDRQLGEKEAIRILEELIKTEVELRK